MSQQAELINAAKNYIVKAANREGISLRDEFATQSDFIKMVLATTFKTLTDAGVETSEAYDAIFGEGRYDALLAKAKAKALAK